jgi:hypothetical protein
MSADAAALTEQQAQQQAQALLPPQPYPLSADQLAILVRCTCAFVKKISNRVGLQLVSQCTALVYLHRFVKVQGLDVFDRFVIGATCVFLAAKVEEDMRRIDDVAKAAVAVRDYRPSNGAAADAPLGSPSGPVLPEGSPQALGLSAQVGSSSGGGERDSLRAMREKILLCERVVLCSLSFDLSVTHPHLPALAFLKRLKVQIRDKEKEKSLSEFRQAAWNFLNDSLYSDMCLRYKPDEMGAASVLLASIYLRGRFDTILPTTQKAVEALEKDLKERPDKLFDIDRRRVEKICMELMDVYEAPRPFILEPRPPPAGAAGQGFSTSSSGDSHSSTLSSNGSSSSSSSGRRDEGATNQLAKKPRVS